MKYRHHQLTMTVTLAFCRSRATCLFLVVALLIPGHAMAQKETDLSSEQIRQAAEGVMEQDDFRRLREQNKNSDEGFLSKLLKRLDDKPERQDSDHWNGGSESAVANSVAAGIGQLLMVIALLAIAVLIGFAIVLIVRSIERQKRIAQATGPPTPIEIENITSTPPGETPTEQYRLRAEDYARTGDYRAAVRQLLLGSMSWIERCGLVHFRRGLTNRDYWRAVYRQEPRRLAFGTIAFEFEKVFFGRRPATAEMYQDCLNQFLKEFHEQRAVTTN